MSTYQQITANQANARKSTGPQTEAGKARSSQNAFKHGLRTQEFVVLPQDQPEFDQLRDNLFEEIRPQGALALLHFENLLEAAWNRRRCRRAEAALAREIGKDPIGDQANQKRLATIDRYSRRAERAFNKAHKELMGAQTKAARQQNQAAAAPAQQPKAPRRYPDMELHELIGCAEALRYAGRHAAVRVNFARTNPIPFTAKAAA